VHIVGQVFGDVLLECYGDVEAVRRGIQPSPPVRSVRLARMLVDTGASHVDLPLPLIEELGLFHVRTVKASTATGDRDVRVFQAVHLTVTVDGESRSGVYEVIELPGGREPLLGLIVLEGLGIVPDVVNHRLLFLPEQGPDTHFFA
jgi:predicted aspartyl protease